MKKLGQLSTLTKITLVLAAAVFMYSCGGGGGGGGGAITWSPFDSTYSTGITGTATSLTVSGNVTVTEGHYDVAGLIYVPDGTTLTLEPGVTMRFAQDGGIIVESDGTFVAHGTSADPITFTGATKARGFWRGLYFMSDRLANRLNFCTVEYGGGYEYTGCMCANVIIDSAGSADTIRLRMTNTNLSNSGAWGMFSQAETVFGDFGCNTITANAAGPAYVYPAVAGYFDNASTYSGNGTDRVYVYGGYSGIDSDATWSALDVEYFVHDVLYVNTDATLTVAAGATIVFDEDAGMELVKTATLIADGTSGSPITFTGAEKTRGYWRGIYSISDRLSGVMDYCTVEYGGGYEYTGCMCANLVFDSEGSADTVRFSITNSNFSNSGAWGMFSHAETIFGDFGCNNFTANAGGPAFVYPPVVKYFDNASNYAGNDTDYLRIQGDYSGIETNATWQALNADYLVDGLLYVGGSPAPTFTVMPGATLRFTEGSVLDIGGYGDGIIVFEGTASRPITFTGSQQTKGWWYGIYILNQDSLNNLMDYCVIEYAGRTGYGTGGVGANLQLDSSGYDVRCGITNCTFQHGSGDGIWVCTEFLGTIGSGNSYSDLDGSNVNNE